jgi:membrane protein involved in colicin uptake
MDGDDMSFLDKLKQKAEDLELDKKAKELADAATKAAQQAKEKAGEIAHEQRDKVEEVLDKAGHAIDEKTEGKYHDKVVKAKESVVKGVDKLAEQRVAAPAEGAVDEPGPYFDPDAAASPAGPSTAGPVPDDQVMTVEPAVGDEAVTGDEAMPGTGPGTSASGDGSPSSSETGDNRA